MDTTTEARVNGDEVKARHFIDDQADCFAVRDSEDGRAVLFTRSFRLADRYCRALNQGADSDTLESICGDA